MYAIRSYYERGPVYGLPVRLLRVEARLEEPGQEQRHLGVGLEGRITSYNVCYTKLLRIPSALLYVLLLYAVPVAVTTRLILSPANRLAAWLFRFPMAVSAAVHLAVLYASLHLWADVSDYRVLVLKLTLIAVMVTLSLNVINGSYNFV